MSPRHPLYPPLHVDVVQSLFFSLNRRLRTRRVVELSLCGSATSRYSLNLKFKVFFIFKMFIVIQNLYALCLFLFHHAKPKEI